MKLSLWILGIVLLSLSWAQKKDPQKMQVRRFLERLNELEKQLEIENLRIQKRELLFRAYLKRGEEKFQQERYEDALRFFQGAQLLDPLSAKSFIGFAKIERVRKNLDTCVSASFTNTCARLGRACAFDIDLLRQCVETCGIARNQRHFEPAARRIIDHRIPQIARRRVAAGELPVPIFRVRVAQIEELNLRRSAAALVLELKSGARRSRNRDRLAESAFTTNV